MKETQWNVFHQMHIKRHRPSHNARELPFPKAFPLVSFFIFLFFVPFFLPAAYAGDLGTGLSDSLSALRKGRELLEKGQYDEALARLETAYSELPVIGDYTLYFMAKAYNESERFEESARRIDCLLKTYPDSPLRKKARALQVDNIFLIRDAERRQTLSGRGPRVPLSPQKSEEALRYLEQYVADYPDDTGMTFFLARSLSKEGKIDRAKKMFIEIYAGNTAFSDLARQELQPSDITPQVMLAKASNLLKAYEYTKAETVLRKILPSVRDPLKEEVLKNLGQALFRQKRYKEAAEIFLKAGDLYNGSRSLYRAGDINAFRKTVSRLMSMEDNRAGSLLIIYAARKRREGRTEEALQIYQDVKKRYPSLTEDALWGMAWAAYRGGNYGAATETLAELNERYPASRYSYWKQRAAEKEAGSAEAPRLLAQSEKAPTVTTAGGKTAGKDFYHMLSSVRDMDTVSSRAVTRAAWTERAGRTALDDSRDMEHAQLPPDISPLFERFAILKELDMKDEAVGELVRMSNKITRPDLLISLCRTLQRIGAYKRSIGMISRFSEQKGTKWGDDSGVADILYPLAYWPTVTEMADRYSLDPFILLAVMREESRFDPQARSVAGALGLMQIMPHTAFSLDKHVGMEIGDASEISDIRTNLTLGAYCLNSLMKEFGSLPLALAAYNAGRDRVREWMKEGSYKASDEFIEDIPYDETRNYVKRVLQSYFTYLSLGEQQNRGN